MIERENARHIQPVFLYNILNNCVRMESGQRPSIGHRFVELLRPTTTTTTAHEHTLTRIHHEFITHFFFIVDKQRQRCLPYFTEK